MNMVKTIGAIILLTLTLGCLGTVLIGGHLVVEQYYAYGLALVLTGSISTCYLFNLLVQYLIHVGKPDRAVEPYKSKKTTPPRMILYDEDRVA